MKEQTIEVKEGSILANILTTQEVQAKSARAAGIGDFFAKQTDVMGDIEVATEQGRTTIRLQKGAVPIRVIRTR